MWQWDYNTGKPTVATDLNGVRTLYSYNDPLDRLTQKVQAAGLTNFETQTNVVYSSPTDVNVYNDQTTAGDEALRNETLYDGFGREVQTNRYEGGESYIATTKTYDALGRVLTATNPSRPGDGLNYATTYAYDALGRVISVTTADGAVEATSYSGYYTTTTDQAGNSRVKQTDALGRLTAVWENPGGLNYETAYGYDALGDLAQVSQGAETRSFAYDGLGRLTASVQPESGTTSYTYDGVGNVLTQTDARSITTTYRYDALNRVTQKTYSDGTPAAAYQYDGLGYGYSWGHLVSTSNGNSTTTYTSIDPLGRVTASNQQTAGGTYGFTYAYNLAGSLTSETYPSGRVVNTGYDAANRVNAVTGSYSSTQTNYVANASYAPQGAPLTYSYGNGVWPGFTYNNRLQPNQVYATLNNNGNQFLYYYWLNWGAANNNGNLLQFYDEVGDGVPYSSLTAYVQNYSYDALNRISSASDSGGWSRNFAYDQYGNGWVTNPAGVGYSLITPAWNVYNTQNQIGSSPYDAAGNMLALKPVGLTFTYDAENRQTSESNAGGMSATYLYDADGKRVGRILSSGETTTYVYDALGRLAAEYASQSGGYPCITCYLSYDHLGSLRMVTDQNANVIARHDYLPFGDEIPGSTVGRSDEFGPGLDGVNQKFTGKERDSETGLDFFQARYYALGIERFMSADPENAGADASNPQSWNGYSYVISNPLNSTDPDGQEPCNADGIDPKTGSFCVDTTAQAIMNTMYVFPTLVYIRAADQIQQGLRNAVDWLGAPRDPNCMSGMTAGGALAGSVGGGVLGLAGGPLAEVTSPGGALAGSALGGALGRAGGVVACMTGSGTDGGEGDGAGGASAADGEATVDKPIAQLKKLSPSEVGKLEAEGGAHKIKSEALGSKTGISQYDLYKDAQGNIYVAGKGGTGEAVPTGLNIKHF